MVGQQQFLVVEVLDGVEEAAQQLGAVQVRPLFADLPIHLRQGARAQAVAPLAQVDQDQIGVAPVPAQLWRQGAAHVAHRREGGHD